MKPIFIILFSLWYWESITVNFFPGLILVKPISVIFLSRFDSNKTNPGEFFSSSTCNKREPIHRAFIYLSLYVEKISMLMAWKSIERVHDNKIGPGCSLPRDYVENFHEDSDNRETVLNETISYLEWEVSLPRRAEYSAKWIEMISKHFSNFPNPIHDAFR